MRPAVVIPTLMPLPQAVERLADADQQLACVIDKYGGFAGILTVEDLGEELVGELTDEHDAGVPEQIVPGTQHEWRMNGDVHLDEVERAIGHRLPEGDFETIAGLLTAQTGELPRHGERVTVDLPDDPAEVVTEEPVDRALEVEVREVDRHVPSEVVVRLVTRPHDGTEPAADVADHDPNEEDHR